MARPSTHLIVCTGLAAVQLARTRRLMPALAPFVSGFLIDADHLFEIARFRWSGGKKQGQAVLPLHGWEYLAAFALIERWLGGRLGGGLLLGYLGHLVVDQFTNTITHPLTYFVLFRWRRDFDSRLFAHPDEGDIDWLHRSVFDLWREF